MRKQYAFTLIEVLFAISFLIMVGVALSALNSAATRFVTATELKTSGNGLNEQALAVVSLLAKTDSNFYNNYVSASGVRKCGTADCYLICPENVAMACSIETTKQSIRLGENRMPFTTLVKIKEITGTTSYSVSAATSWGNGTRDQVSAAQIIEL